MYFGRVWEIVLEMRHGYVYFILLSVLKLLVSLFALLKKYVNILKPYRISGKNLELRRWMEIWQRLGYLREIEILFINPPCSKVTLLQIKIFRGFYLMRLNEKARFYLLFSTTSLHFVKRELNLHGFWFNFWERDLIG